MLCFGWPCCYASAYGAVLNMAAYINIVSINGDKEGRKKSQTPLNAARHNLREIQAELKGEPGARIDPNRSRLNIILSGPATGKEVEALMFKLIADAGAIIKRKDSIKMFEVVVSIGEEIKDEAGFFEDARLWMVSHYDCPLVSAVVHYDESEAHMHLLFVPLRNGKLDGHAIMGGPAELKRMQADFLRQVGAKHGIEARRRYSASERSASAGKSFRELKHNPNRMNEANVEYILKKCIATYAQEVQECLGIERLEALTAIAVESASGSTTKTNHKEQSQQLDKANRYLCVAVDLPASLPVDESCYQRTKDSDLNPKSWDEVRGEFSQEKSTGPNEFKKMAQDEIRRTLPQSWKQRPPFVQIASSKVGT